MKNYITHTLGIIAILALFAGFAYNGNAQTPDYPYNLTATAVNTSDGSIQVKLAWEFSRQNSTSIYYFNIYIAEGQTEDASMFKKINYVKFQAGTDFYYLVNQLSNGWYSFYVTAVKYDNNQQNESQRSNIASVEVKGDDKPYIKIHSTPPPYAKVGEKYEYQMKAESNIRCPILYQMMMNYDNGMKIDKQTGLLTWVPEKEGTYGGAIKAYLECDETVYAIQQFSINVGQTNNDKPYVKIVSQPYVYGEAGKEYVYKIKAESNVKCPIIYKWAIGGPTNVGSVDWFLEGAGSTVKWVPERDGYYYLRVIAYLECDNNVMTQVTYKIIIGKNNGSDFCAEIFGAVYYDDGTAVSEGVVTAWKNYGSVDNYTKPLYKAEIGQGYFNIKVPEGEYLLQFTGSTFEPEWYEDAKEMKEAKAFKVACGDKYELKTLVTKYPAPNYYVVSGYVKSEDENKPVMSYIYFYPVKYNNKKTDPPDKTYPGFMAKTDVNGYYKIQLPDNLTYTAQAVPLGKNSIGDGSQYLPQYYDRVDNPMEADIIVITGDLEGIDFLLKKAQTYNNGFAGKVVDAEGNGLKARLVANLVLPENSASPVKFTLSTETDENGNFSFKNLIPGDYVVLSAPANGKYIPGYYKKDDFVTQKWREADKISVGDGMITIVYEFKHKLLKAKEGNIRIKGKVSDGNWNYKGSDETQGSDAIAGVHIYLTDEYGEIVGSTFTDTDGNFEISGLDAGEYNLNADKLGYDFYMQNVQTDYKSNSSVEANIVLVKSISAVDDDIANSGIVVYPQPAANYINVRLDELQGDAVLNVYNALGMRLDSREINTRNVKINTEFLSAGMYYITFENNGARRTAAFSISR